LMLPGCTSLDAGASNLAVQSVGGYKLTPQGVRCYYCNRKLTTLHSNGSFFEQRRGKQTRSNHPACQ